MTSRVLVFVKEPQVGRVKTRLIPALGAVGACKLAAQLFEHTMSQLQALCRHWPTTLLGKQGEQLQISLVVSPSIQAPYWQQFVTSMQCDLHQQVEGDLGQRMAAMIEPCCRNGERVVCIGTDCPDLGVADLSLALTQLHRHDLVIRPAVDGGYVLIGLRQFIPELFTAMPWSTATLLETSLARLPVGLSINVGQTLRDIDLPGDLTHPIVADWLATAIVRPE